MRKLLILSTLFCAFMASCELETSDNGDLDGYWQLTTIDSLAADTSVGAKDMQVFWAVQSDLLQATKMGGDRVLFRFQNTGDSLFLSDPRTNDRTLGDTAVTDITLMQPLGINSLTEHFAIEQLSGSSMTLKSPTLRLHFRKY